MWFTFSNTRQPSPGAEAYAFGTATKNPVFPLFAGPGVPYRSGAIMATQPAQVYYPGALLTTTGLGGLIYGTFYNAPLYTPPYYDALANELNAQRMGQLP